MNSKQAAALLRLANDDDFLIYVTLLDELQAVAIDRLQSLDSDRDIYRMQGECRGLKKVRGLFDEAQELLSNSTKKQAATKTQTNFI